MHRVHLITPPILVWEQVVRSMSRRANLNGPVGCDAAHG